jgi:ketosteroid isomerase-like protein
MTGTTDQTVAMATLREAYSAFNRGDMDAAVAGLDPQIEWNEPPEFPGGGAYHGREAVKGYLTQSRANWAEGASEPEQMIPAGDRIVVMVHARFRLKGSETLAGCEARRRVHGARWKDRCDAGVCGPAGSVAMGREVRSRPSPCDIGRGILKTVDVSH